MNGQGKDGGEGSSCTAGGGGYAQAAFLSGCNAYGGRGLQSNFTGVNQYYAGGGGGAGGNGNGANCPTYGGTVAAGVLISLNCIYIPSYKWLYS